MTAEERAKAVHDKIDGEGLTVASARDSLRFDEIIADAIAQAEHAARAAERERCALFVESLDADFDVPSMQLEKVTAAIRAQP